MAGNRSAPLVERAPAKVNLTLHVLGRRADGMHELESLVAFAHLADQLTFAPGGALELTVNGRYAEACGPPADNLVLRAAYALADEIDGLALGSFRLFKMLPVAAGLGGGSADAAAALRLLARAYGLALDDPRISSAARRTGADVPVCLDPRARLMRGIGDIVSAPVALPRLAAVLVNPGVPLATKEVFAAFARQRSGPPKPGSTSGKGMISRTQAGFVEFLRGGGKTLRTTASALVGKQNAPAEVRYDSDLETAARAIPRTQAGLLQFLQSRRNDLEPAAISLQPVIVDVLGQLRKSQGCLLARMSGAGATCFGIYESVTASEAAAYALSKSSWWVHATTLGAA